MAGIQKRQCSYDLEHVKMLMANGRYLISDQALTDAAECFEWTDEEIVGAIQRLRPRHWLKSNASRRNPQLAVDHYSLRFRKKGVYLHFSLDFVDGEEKVLIESFHAAGG